MKILVGLATLIFMIQTQSLFSQKISRTASLTINSKIENVFPLFGPVREKEWAFGWNPVIISGEGDVSEHMIFTTPGRYEDEPEYLWAVTKYYPEKYLIEYTVSSKDRIWFITVQCKDLNMVTIADVIYTYVGLTEVAVIRNKESADKMFARNLLDWEDAINHYLLTGNQLQE